MNYIKTPVPSGCIFCAIRREKKDAQNYVVLRSESCFVVLNTYPYNNGHLMVVANRHLAALEKLSDTEILDLNKTVIKAKLLLDKCLKPQGFNIGINLGKVSGAGIEKHLHIHIVPRWMGDTNFMPVSANTKVISQSLRELHNQLKKAL